MKGIPAIGLALFLVSAHAAVGQNEYRLAGIIGQGGEFRAALLEIDDGEQRFVRVGDTVGQDRLLEIHKDWVLLSGPRGERRLFLQGLPSDGVSVTPVRTGGGELHSETFRALDRLEREIDGLEPEVGRKRFNAAVGLTESAHVQAVDHRPFESIADMVRYVTSVLVEEGGVVRLDLSGDRHTEVYLKIDWEE